MLSSNNQTDEEEEKPSVSEPSSSNESNYKIALKSILLTNAENEFLHKPMNEFIDHLFKQYKLHSLNVNKQTKKEITYLLRNDYYSLIFFSFSFRLINYFVLFYVNVSLNVLHNVNVFYERMY